MPRLPQLIETKEEFLRWRQSLISHSVGLVATMGNLHAGHISLVEKSFQENEHTIVTIFVNPKQFGPKEDFAKYPRTLSEDEEKLMASWKRLTPSKNLIIFAPKTTEEIYPPKFLTTISVGKISKLWEGTHRPGHFEGVATVVYLLFQIIKPSIAYFGAKDFQQVQVIKKMTTDLLLDIKIMACPIVRDHDGLALSSRNQYLTTEGRKQSLVLPQTLNLAAKILIEEDNFENFSAFLEKTKENDDRWEYLAYCDSETLINLKQKQPNGILLGVYKVDGTRLLDNLLITLTIKN
ncbi:MAG: pantoate--beta-alanine ligase [Bacteriovoracaceae bacterium]|nr:pantoate--beta-alanine ligase [Bacteriovoracaceae bacterium]